VPVWCGYPCGITAQKVADQRRIDLSWRAEHCLPQTVTGKAHKLVQMLNNFGACEGRLSSMSRYVWKAVR